MGAVAYLGGGAQCNAPHVRLHLIRRCDFLRFKISEKMGEFAAFIERSKAKCFSFRGGFAPSYPPTTGFAPGPR